MEQKLQLNEFIWKFKRACNAVGLRQPEIDEIFLTNTMAINGKTRVKISNRRPYYTIYSIIRGPRGGRYDYALDRTNEPDEALKALLQEIVLIRLDDYRRGGGR